jgi:hypothetical protein
MVTAPQVGERQYESVPMDSAGGEDLGPAVDDGDRLGPCPVDYVRCSCAAARRKRLCTSSSTASLGGRAPMP